MSSYLHALQKALVTCGSQELILAIARRIVVKGGGILAISALDQVKGVSVCDQTVSFGTRPIKSDIVDMGNVFPIVDQTVSKMGAVNTVINLATLPDSRSLLKKFLKK